MFNPHGVLILVPLYIIGLLALGASITSGIFVFHVAVVPLLFKYSRAFRRNLVFANFVQWPLNIDYDEPSTCGVEGARNVNIEFHSRVDNCPVSIGLWHILPKSSYDRLKERFDGSQDKMELNSILDHELANSKTPIILYCHGNSNSRAAEHRIQLYKFFQQMDFHTITFDYRGYGDSSKIRPTENGVVEDALVVYEWLRTTVDKGNSKAPIFVWGHSLGTAISAHFLGHLKEMSTIHLGRPVALPPPNGLILEAPFSNLPDEVAKHPLSKLVTWLPYYEATFVAPFRTDNFQRFMSDAHLSRVPSLPILILHAKDDVIVPFVVGLKLYKSIQESRSKGGATIALHAYEKSEDLGHKWICRASDLSDVVGNFVRSHQ